jgi:hypothetical protein
MRNLQHAGIEANSALRTANPPENEYVARYTEITTAKYRARVKPIAKLAQ